MDTSELGEDQNSVPYDFCELFCMTEDFDIGIFFCRWTLANFFKFSKSVPCYFCELVGHDFDFDIGIFFCRWTLAKLQNFYFQLTACRDVVAAVATLAAVVDVDEVTADGGTSL